MLKTSDKSVFHFVLIKLSHYDDEGYVIQWLRSAVPSNTLAVLNGLALDCADRGVPGGNAELVVNSHNESNTRIRPDKIAKQIKKSGGKGLVHGELVIHHGPGNLTLYRWPPDAEMNSSGERRKANAINRIEFSVGTGLK